MCLGWTRALSNLVMSDFRGGGLVAGTHTS